MHPFPHRYHVTANAAAEGRVRLEHLALAPIESASPVEFDGPGDAWSPEGLLVAAVADCLVLTFRAVARAAHLDWRALTVSATGVLEREGGKTRFTGFDVEARLQVGAEVGDEQAIAALHRAERGCLISNSLAGEVRLTVLVER